MDEPMTARTAETAACLERFDEHNSRSEATKARMLEAREKRQLKAAKKKDRRASPVKGQGKTDDPLPFGESDEDINLGDLSGLVAEIEAEAFEFEITLGARTAREAAGQVALGGESANVKPSSKLITMESISEEPEDDEEDPPEPVSYSLGDLVGGRSRSESELDQAENEVFARLFAEAAGRAEVEAQEALADMGKEEKKVRKGMEKLGMVPLDKLAQVRVTLADGTVMLMRQPEVYVLPRHTTNPGPDRVVFFGSNMIEDYDSDDVETRTPKHSPGGQPAEGALSGFARTLLGKYLQDDITVDDGVVDTEEAWHDDGAADEYGDGDEGEYEEGDIPGEDTPGEYAEQEGDSSGDDLPPSPVHHLSPGTSSQNETELAPYPQQRAPAASQENEDADAREEAARKHAMALGAAERQRRAAAAAQAELAEVAGESDDDSDCDMPSPVHHQQSPAQILDAIETAARGDSRSASSSLSPKSPKIPGFEPMSPARKAFLAEKAKFNGGSQHSPGVVAPPMTARTEENVAKLDELQAFVNELSPPHSGSDSDEDIPTGLRDC